MADPTFDERFIRLTSGAVVDEPLHDDIVSSVFRRRAVHAGQGL
jgi:hypothetical protein